MSSVKWVGAKLWEGFLLVYFACCNKLWWLTTDIGFLFVSHVGGWGLAVMALFLVPSCPILSPWLKEQTLLGKHGFSRKRTDGNTRWLLKLLPDARCMSCLLTLLWLKQVIWPSQVSTGQKYPPTQEARESHCIGCGCLILSQQGGLIVGTNKSIYHRKEIIQSTKCKHLMFLF